MPFKLRCARGVSYWKPPYRFTLKSKRFGKFLMSCESSETDRAMCNSSSAIEAKSKVICNFDSID